MVGIKTIINNIHLQRARIQRVHAESVHFLDEIATKRPVPAFLALI